jgi:hypothetical protein
MRAATHALEQFPKTLWKQDGVLAENFERFQRTSIRAPHPVISSANRMKLVGFLLHPVSRSETWRRLFHFQVKQLTRRNKIGERSIALGRRALSSEHGSHHASRTTKQHQDIVLDLG